MRSATLLSSALPRSIVGACVFMLPWASAQMPMPMPVAPARPQAEPQPRVEPHQQPRAHAATSSLASGRAADSPAQPQRDAQSIRFGQLADGDTSTAARPVSAVPDTPSVDPQAHEPPQQHTAKEAPSMPDLLADAKGREPLSLRFFEDQASARNPTLREAEAQVRRLRSEAKQAALWQNPEIGYEADHVRGGSYAGGEQGGYVQQTIPLAGQRSSARAVLAAETRAAQTLADAQAERVRSGVEQAFYAALATQREVRLHEQLALLAADNAVALHQYANVGQADAPDVLGSEIEREQARLELISVQRSYRKAFAQLAAVSGNAGMAPTLLTGDLEDIPVLARREAADLAERSPLVKAARQEVFSNAAAVRSAHAQAGPQLTLRAGLQQDNEPLDPSLRRVGVVGIAQAGLTLPLWNRNQGAVAAASARQAAAEAEVERTQNVLHLQAEQVLQDYENAAAQVERYRDELMPRAQRAVELYDTKYAGMAAAYPQRVAARRMLLQLQLEYTRQLAAAWKSSVLVQHGLLQDGLGAPVTIGQAAQGAEGNGTPLDRTGGVALR